MSWKDILKSLYGENNGSHGNASSSSRNSSNSISLPDHFVQYSGVTRQSQRKQLVIGFDFGTAFTKVVIGEDRVRYAVPWTPRAVSGKDYLLPCTFYQTDDGNCDLSDNGGRQVTELKMRLLQGDFDKVSLANICAFNALVLRRVRSFLLNNYHSTYGSNLIDWMLNVGLPTNNFHDDGLENTYRKLFYSAWWISAQPGPVTIEACKNTMDRDDFGYDENMIDQSQISIFPEFVAQVTGYVRSPSREGDLHLLIDVGAGTVDSTVFNVHRDDGEDRYPIFDMAVEHLGTRFLIRNRLRDTDIVEDGELGHFSPIPSKSRFSQMLGITEFELQEIDMSFCDKLQRVIRKRLSNTKDRRYPMSETWENGIPLFLCGGGANCDFYKDAITGSETLRGFKLLPKKLPRPDSSDFIAEGLGSEEFDRLSVAFGLSYEPFDIGEIIRFEDVDDIEKDQEAVSADGPISCSQCNGSGGLHQTCSQCGGSGFIQN